MELYKPDEISIFEKKQKGWTVAACILGVLIAAACIWVCTLTTPYNGEQMEYIVCGIFVVGGWIEIYFWLDIILVYRKEKSHTQLILESERQVTGGRVEIRKETFHIPQSITVRKVIVRNGEEIEKLNVDVRRERDILALNGKEAVLTSAHGYIIAWEVPDENH